MRYTVVWTPYADRQLINLYLAASDKSAVQAACDRIDRDLLNDAETKGTPMGIYRIYRDDPLAVLYRVIPDDCMVKVISVRRTI